MPKKTRYLGYDSGQGSSKKWFTPNPQPHAGNGDTGSTFLKAVKVIFRDDKGRKQK